MSAGKSLAGNFAQAAERRKSVNRVIFVLGAGASRDAGMPLVAQLTEELRDRLPGLRINGKTRPEFPKLFDAIVEHDPDVKDNYERFFEWLGLLGKVQRNPFRRALRVEIEPDLAAVVGELAFRIKLPIWEILRSRHHCATYRPDYLAKLGEFLPERGRLKAFTLNYDLSVEDACRAQGIDVITGFQPSTGRWNPSGFRARTRGINLYKLHGSLNWVLDDNLPDRRLIEYYPPQWDKEPELLLGPGVKLQHDDPFVTVYSEFHKALRRAKVCVVIGYSFRDDHIKEPLREASRRGMTIVDVNPLSIETGFENYKEVSLGAKEALESDAILDATKNTR